MEPSCRASFRDTIARRPREIDPQKLLPSRTQSILEGVLDLSQAVSKPIQKKQVRRLTGAPDVLPRA
jgi:hypothetical protein